MTTECKSKCSECDFLGDAVFVVVRWRIENKEAKSQFIGFSDRPNGDVTDNPSRHCNCGDHRPLKVLVYESLPYEDHCSYFKPREWDRPKTCGECNRKIVVYRDGSFTCSGSLFTDRHRFDEKACINGMVNKLGQSTFLDLVSLEA